MATKLGEGTQVTVDLKTIGMIIGFTITIASMYFIMQADIAEAKELPVIPPDEVTRMEFNMKDQMARNKIDILYKEIDDINEEIKLLRK